MYPSVCAFVYRNHKAFFKKEKAKGRTADFRVICLRGFQWFSAVYPHALSAYCAWIFARRAS